MLPLFSIIVPIYNSELFIEKTINSVLSQSFKNFELIIVDDGSTDNSFIICEQIAQKDPRILLFRKQNGGVSSARNYGIDNARGEWILFVDSDDYIDKDYIQSFVSELHTYSLSFHYGCKIFHSNKKKELYYIEEEEVHRDSDIFIHLYNKNLLFSSVWCKVFNKAVIKHNSISFQENINNGEDRLFVSDYLLCPEITTISSIENFGYNYVLRRGSITHSDIHVESFCLSNICHYYQFKDLIKKFGIIDNKFLDNNMSIIKKNVYNGLLLLIKSDVPRERKKDIYRKIEKCLKELRLYKTNKKLDQVFRFLPFNVCILLIGIVYKFKLS